MMDGNRNWFILSSKPSVNCIHTKNLLVLESTIISTVHSCTCIFIWIHQTPAWAYEALWWVGMSFSRGETHVVMLKVLMLSSLHCFAALQLHGLWETLATHAWTHHPQQVLLVSPICRLCHRLAFLDKELSEGKARWTIPGHLHHWRHMCSSPLLLKVVFLDQQYQGHLGAC